MEEEKNELEAQMKAKEVSIIYSMYSVYVCMMCNVYVYCMYVVYIHI